MTIFEVFIKGIGDSCTGEDEVEGIGDGGGWKRGQRL